MDPTANLSWEKCFFEGKHKVSSQVGNVLGIIWDLFGSSRMPNIIVFHRKFVFFDSFWSCLPVIKEYFWSVHCVYLTENLLLKEDTSCLETDWNYHVNILEYIRGGGSDRKTYWIFNVFFFFRSSLISKTFCGRWIPQHTCHGRHIFWGKQKVSNSIENILGTIWDLFGASVCQKSLCLKWKVN